MRANLKRLGLILFLLFPAAVLAAPDEFIGDTAIYTGESTSLRPNVLFIIDNSNTAANASGSGQAYDPAHDYTPESGGAGRYAIYKAGQQGEFTQLEVSNSTSSLENLNCPNNSNIIKATLLATGTYAGRGTDSYPSIKNGSCDTKKAYTYALGNYLNYLNTPADSGEAESQAKQIYDAVKRVVESTRFAVKFGAMVFDNTGNKGGKIVYPVSDLTDNAKLQAFLDHLPGSGSSSAPGFLTSQTARPQAETLLDAGYYFQGKALPISGGSAMTSPITLTCDKNFIIMITNGLSNKDDDSALGTIVGDRDEDGQEAAQYGTGGTHYLDDVAQYLYETDASPLADHQNLVTATILAFQNDDELVRRAGLLPSAGGAHGRGGYHNVFNTNELSEALTKLLANIVAESDTSFVAPVVPASTTNRTISSNRVYIGLFKPVSQRAWIGNLKKYGVNNQNQLVDRDGDAANDPNGNFILSSLSYWGANAEGKIMTVSSPREASEGDGGLVDAGGVGGTLKARILAGTPRKIYTYLGVNTDLTHDSNLFSKTTLTAANSGITDDALRDKIVDYFNGIDVFDDDEDGSFSDTRPWILGDILHSKPLVFNYTSYPATAEGTCYNKNTGAGNSSMIFVGSNDGMFHAFRDCDGEEEWAFVPDNLLPDLPYLQESAHTYFVDASPTAYIHDYNSNGIIEGGTGGKDKVILLFGQRRGGGKNNLSATGSRGAYYALDVSEFDKPKFLWKIDGTTSDFAEMGETWSQPRIAMVKIGSESRVVAIFGGGYDNNEDLRFGNTQGFPAGTTTTTNLSLPSYDSGSVTSDGTGSQLNPRGRGVFMVEIARLSADASGKLLPDFTHSGELVWKYTGTSFSIPSDVTVLDTNADGFQDRIYVGDTGGRLWRFNIGDADTANWTGNIIFKANPGADGTNGRKIFNKPSISILDGHPVLYFGTGDRAHPLNTAVQDRIYAVRDRGQTTADAINEADDLKDLTENTLQENSATAEQITAILSALESETNYGWYIKLNQNPGEKVLAPAVVFNKNVFYTTYAPNTGVVPDPCSPGNLGTSRLYHLDYATGEAAFNYNTGNDSSDVSGNERAAGDGGVVLRRADRVRDIGVGIPSGIVTMIDASGKVTMMTSSSNKVNTYAAPDSKLITPLYWIKW